MFRRPGLSGENDVSFPRIRGDVPSCATSGELGSAFSPHTRGCSGVVAHHATATAVFPAYAGMFLNRHPGVLRVVRFPRIRGDVPLDWSRTRQAAQFSPHTRGCSANPHQRLNIRRVFPAYAGMFRAGRKSQPALVRFPRIRGDVPGHPDNPHDYRGFSPHTRGCSDARTNEAGHRTVFPAYAGMFRRVISSRSNKRRFPRIRGDVPQGVKGTKDTMKFSPHTRGCSAAQSTEPAWLRVFPAYAGMFRNGRIHHRGAKGFPRIRGDVPSDYDICVES